MCQQEIVELALRLADALKRAKALQMGASYVGDQATVGLSSLYECLDVARMRGTHLYNGNIVAVVEAEQRLGNANVVVEVTLRRHDVITLSQHSTNQFLRGRLAVGTSNANDGNVELATMLASQVLIGLQAVVNEDEVLL